MDFFKKRRWLLHILLALLVYVVFFWISASVLKSYTQHGETLSVPDMRGMSMQKVQEVLKSKGFEYKVVDSAYNAKRLPMTVLDQTPSANAKVKQGRTIYLTVNSKLPPQIKMPDLKDASLKQAQLILESAGLNIGKLIYKPDLAQNAVLDQLYKGEHIEAGTSIKKGATIDLVLGDGLGATEVEVPDLFGLTLREVKFVIDGSSLNLGRVIADNSVKGDTLDAWIYKQYPEYPSEHKVNVGDVIDVYVTKDKSVLNK